MMTKISKGFYMGSVYGSFVGGIALVAIGGFVFYDMLQNPYIFRYGPPTGTMILAITCYLLGCWFMAYGFVVENILIYRMWDVIRDKKTRITPGKAVAFIFVPVFGLYWMYQAYWGCAVDYNRYIREKKIVEPPVSEAVPLILCVLLSVWYTVTIILPFLDFTTTIPPWLPGLVSLLLGLPVFILRIIFYNQMIDAGNEILVKR